ncbi:MAG: signal peptidase II [Myxococcota bacterium]|nr:signal peptidase II [Myxococcota bacterium]
MTEPIETTDSGPVQSGTGVVVATETPVPGAPEEIVPGERLGVPVGATRVIADYGRPHPSYVFLGLVSIVTLACDVVTKAWAARHLDAYPGVVEVWNSHVTLVLARNRGGAWGLLQSTSENVRRPFFLLVSVAAIAFIMALYRRLLPRQRALRWGLPLVLGGALGNVLDRVRYGQVIDFIDVHVPWKGADHHWPTFNVADIAICVGVGLMAIDMFTSKRGHSAPALSRVPPALSGEPAEDWTGGTAEPHSPMAASSRVGASSAAEQSLDTGVESQPPQREPHL